MNAMSSTMFIPVVFTLHIFIVATLFLIGKQSAHELLLHLMSYVHITVSCYCLQIDTSWKWIRTEAPLGSFCVV
jgi:uncharacterized membrane protein